MKLLIPRLLLLIFLALGVGRPALASAFWLDGDLTYPGERTCLFDEDSFDVPFAIDAGAGAGADRPPAPAAGEDQVRTKVVKAKGKRHVKNRVKHKVRLKGKAVHRSVRKPSKHTASRPQTPDAVSTQKTNSKVRAPARPGAGLARKMAEEKARKAYRGREASGTLPRAIAAPAGPRKPAHGPAEPKKNVLYAVEPVRLVVPEHLDWPRAPPPRQYPAESRFVRPVVRAPPAWVSRAAVVLGDSLSSSVTQRRPVLVVPLGQAKSIGGDTRLSLQVSRHPQAGFQVSVQLRL